MGAFKELNMHPSMLEYTTFKHNIILPSLHAVNSCGVRSHMRVEHIKLCKHENMHAHMQGLQRTHTHSPMHASTPPHPTPPHTFFQRLANFDIAVCSLEFVEERADFEFICDSLPKLWHNSAVLSRCAHLEHSPLAPLQSLG